MRSNGRGSAVPFLIAVAFAGSVCGHRVMELLGSLPLLHGDYGDYDHVGVAPVGLFALVAVIGGVAITIARTRGTGHASGIAIAGRDLLRLPFAVCALAVVLLQLFALNICENVEHVTAFGQLSDGLEWLGGPPLVALAVHALIAVAGAAVLRRSLGAVLRTCDALFRAVRALAVLLTLPAMPPAVAVRRRSLAHAVHACLLAWNHGLRAPPPAL
jgi:hypothetical protein